MSENYKRVTAVTHLRAARMHIEAAMSADAETWDWTDCGDARDARDTVQNLVDTLDIKIEDRT
jgi:hypothetical protein